MFPIPDLPEDARSLKVRLVGTLPGSGQLVGDIHLGVAPTPDPLAYLPEPDPSTLPIQSTKKLSITGGNRNLQPGVYQGGISFSLQGNPTGVRTVNVVLIVTGSGQTPLLRTGLQPCCSR